MELFELANERMELNICQFSKKNPGKLELKLVGVNIPEDPHPVCQE